MKKLIIGLFAGLFAISAAAYAGGEHEAEGVIKGVNKSKRTITISHGPISGLGMSAMTMDFKVANPAMLMDAQEGKEIEFKVKVDRSGHYIVTDMQAGAFASN